MRVYKPIRYMYYLAVVPPLCILVAGLAIPPGLFLASSAWSYIAFLGCINHALVKS